MEDIIMLAVENKSTHNGFKVKNENRLSRLIRDNPMRRWEMELFFFQDGVSNASFRLIAIGERQSSEKGMSPRYTVLIDKMIKELNLIENQFTPNAEK